MLGEATYRKKNSSFSLKYKKATNKIFLCEIINVGLNWNYFNYPFFVTISLA
jgi:hypothetical protein